LTTTTVEVARRLGLTEQRVRQLCGEGRIVSLSTRVPALKIGRDWIIPNDFTILKHKTHHRVKPEDWEYEDVEVDVPDEEEDQDGNERP
jgi:hypothetical protein